MEVTLAQALQGPSCCAAITPSSEVTSQSALQGDFPCGLQMNPELQRTAQEYKSVGESGASGEEQGS